MKVKFSSDLILNAVIKFETALYQHKLKKIILSSNHDLIL